MDRVLFHSADFFQNFTPVFLRFGGLRQSINPSAFPAIVSYEIKLFFFLVSLSLLLPNCFQSLQSCLKLSIKEQLISLGFSFFQLERGDFGSLSTPSCF